MGDRNLLAVKKGMENIAIENLALNMAGNIGTLALALGLIVIWKRCQMCQSNCHTSWCDFTTPALIQKKVDLYKRAMAEFQRESIRNDRAIEPSRPSARRVREHHGRSADDAELQSGEPGHLV